MFHVVVFDDDSKFAVICEPWLLKENGQYNCWWPNDVKSDSQIRRLVKHEVTPNQKQYTLYRCQVKSSKETYESAHKKLKKILDAGSNLEEALLTTDDDASRRSRASRKRKLPQDSGSESDCDFDIVSHTETKTVVTKITPEKIRKTREVSSLIQRKNLEFLRSQKATSFGSNNLLTNNLDSLNSQKTNSSFNCSGAERASTPSRTQKEKSQASIVPLTEEKFLVYYKKLLSILIHTRMKVDALAAGSRNNAASEVESQLEPNSYVMKWPIERMSDFEQQELRLEDPRNFHEMEFVFSSKGKQKLNKFESTKSYAIVKDAVRGAHTSVDLCEVRSCVQLWFQHKSDRRKDKQKIVCGSSSITNFYEP